MKAFVLAVALALTSLLFLPSAQAADKICSTDTKVVADCFDVHGRLAIYANLRPYLQPAHSKRSYGIVTNSPEPGAGYYWPQAIDKQLTLKSDLNGDFHVCPFTKEAPGKMQFVCIDKAEHLKAAPHPYTK